MLLWVGLKISAQNGSENEGILKKNFEKASENGPPEVIFEPREASPYALGAHVGQKSSRGRSRGALGGPRGRKKIASAGPGGSK